MTMIEVRIRYTEDADSQPFCFVPFGQQNAVVSEIKEKGVYFEGNLEFYTRHQYVSDMDRVFLEIVVGEE